MLLITRKIDEVIRIGNDIQVMVTSIKNSQVSLGIKAPSSVKVHREEIHRLISNSKN